LILVQEVELRIYMIHTHMWLTSRTSSKHIQADTNTHAHAHTQGHICVSQIIFSGPFLMPQIILLIFLLSFRLEIS